MTTSITNLMSALREEVERVVAKRTLAPEDKEALSGILLDSIHRTLREIKMGADSDDFQALAILNFVMGADEQGFEQEVIREFVEELKKPS